MIVEGLRILLGAAVVGVVGWMWWQLAFGRGGWWHYQHPGPGRRKPPGITF